MSEQKQISFTTRIKSLDMVSFKIEETPSDLKIDPDKVTFGIGINLNVSLKDKLVSIGSPIEIYSDESKKFLLGSIHIKGEFLIENMDEVKQGNGVPGPIIATYIGVVVSAARGMLRTLSKGTCFEKAIIPIINPTEILNSVTQKK